MLEANGIVGISIDAVPPRSDADGMAVSGMAEIRPLLIFDTTALLAGKTSQWQEWARFGQCVLPKAVQVEMEYLTQRAVEPEQEVLAREFMRFWPSGEFQVSESGALVGGTIPQRQSLSRRARLQQAIAECAYALAQQQKGTLVVVVSNEPSLVQRMKGLQTPNLSAISVAELGQWSRQHQRPDSIHQAMAAMPGPPIPASSLKSLRLAPFPRAAPPPTSHQPPVKAKSVEGTMLPPLRRFLIILKTIQNTIMIVVALGLLTGSGLLAWRVLDPDSSASIWQTLGLPDIPGLPNPSPPSE
ncbi:MAG: PIN domain-containing protein [Cyanobacteriota bacterium]|nr:PIN domain-containing protein [Cyanobacteriota bacterium]